MDDNILVSVCTILSNCRELIDFYVRDVVKVLKCNYAHYEIVLIDNGSTDNTVARAKELIKQYNNIRLVVLAKEYDEQVAYTAALENSIGDFVIIMDLKTDPPHAILEMLEKSVAGFDIVTAEISERKELPFTYRVFEKAFYRISNFLTEYHIDLNWSNYVCFSRKMVNAILQIKDRVRYLKYLKTDVGYSHATVKYDPIKKQRQRNNNRVLKKLFFAFDTLVSNSEKLIRIATFMALATSIISFGYIFYAVAIIIFKSNVAEGWASTSIVLSFMFSALFFILFIIGEYISLIYRETKKGPLYHVSEEFNSSNLFENMKDKNVI